MTEKVTFAASAVTVKLAERRPKRVRRAVPATVTPPTSTLSTPPPERLVRLANQPDGSPERSASGYCSSSLALNSSTGTVTVVW